MSLKNISIEHSLVAAFDSEGLGTSFENSTLALRTRFSSSRVERALELRDPL